MTTPYQHDLWKDIPYSARPFTQRSYSKYPYIPRAVNRPEEDKGYILDYNDPYEINSPMDVFFNQAALDKVYPRKHDNGRFDVADIPEIVWQRLKAQTILPYRTIGKPLLNTKDGKWKPDMAAVGINFLTGFGETMDVLSNPVKGMILEKEGPLKGLTRGLGVSRDGRKNYDYDFNTGAKVIDWLANLAAEVFSDPFTWISLGQAAFVKFAARGGTDVLVEAAIRAAKDVGQELSQESAERFAKTVMKQIYKNSSDDIAKSISKGVKRAAHKRWYNTAMKNMDDAFLKNFIKHTADIGADQLGMHTIKSIQKFGETFDQIERGLLHGSTYGVFKGAGKLLKRGAVRPVRAFIRSHTDEAFENFRRADGIIPLNKLDAAAEAAEEAMRFKIVDLSDAAETADQIKMMQLLEIQKQINKSEKLWFSSKDPEVVLEKINAHFLEVTDGAFDAQGYIAYLKKFAEKYPHMTGHYVILNAMYSDLMVRVSLKTERDALKLLSDFQKQTKALEDLLVVKNILKDPQTIISELQYIRNNLQILRQNFEAPLIDDILRTTNDIEEALNELLAERTKIQSQYRYNRSILPEANVFNLEMLWDIELSRIQAPATFTAKQKAEVLHLKQLIKDLGFRDHLNLRPENVLAINKQFKKLKKYASEDKQVRNLFKEFFAPDGTAAGVKSLIKRLKKLEEQNRLLAELSQKLYVNTEAALKDIKIEKIKEVKQNLLKNIEMFNEYVDSEKIAYAELFDLRIKTQEMQNVLYQEQGIKSIEHIAGPFSTVVDELLTKLYQGDGVDIDELITKLGVQEDYNRAIQATLLEDRMPFLAPEEYGSVNDTPFYYSGFIEKLRKPVKDLFKVEALDITDEIPSITAQMYTEEFGDISIEEIIEELKEAYARVLNKADNNNTIKKSFEELATHDNLKKFAKIEGFKEEMVAEAHDYLLALNEIIEKYPVTANYDMNEHLFSILNATVISNIQDSPYEYIEGRIVYQLKLSQAETALQLLSIESIQTFCKNVMGNGSYAATLEKLMGVEDLGKYSKEMRAFAYDFIAYSNLLTNIMNMDDTLGNLKYNLFDTLQTFKRRKFKNILNHKESYINEIIDTMQKQITTIEMRKRYSLDALFGENPRTGVKGPYKEDFEKWYKAKGLGKIEQHNAATDIWQTVYLIEKDPRLQSLRDSLDFDKYIYIVTDIETTGLSFGDQLRQLSYVALNDATIQGDILVKTPGLYPSQDLLDLSFGGSKEAYEAVHHAENLPDAGEAVQKYLTHLNELQESTGKTVVLVAQNGDSFDWPMLNRIMRSPNNNTPAGLYRSFRRMETIDTLIHMQAGDDITRLTADQRKVIKDLLTGYIEVKTANPYMDIFNAPFIRTADRDFLITTSDFSQELNSYTLASTRAAKGALPVLDEELFDINQQLLIMRDDVINTLSNIRKRNKALKNIQITYDPDTGIITNTHGVRLDFGESGMQPMHLFTNKSGELMPFALKRIEKTEPTIRRFFGDLSGREFKVSEQQSLYRFSTDAAKISGAIRKVETVTQLYEHYADIGKQAKDLFTSWYLKRGLTPPPVLSMFNPEIIGTMDRFAATYKLISSMRAFAANRNMMAEYENFITSFITHSNREYDEAIRTLLARNNVFDYNTYKRFTSEEFNVGPFDLNATELYKDNASFRWETKGYLGTIDEWQTHLSLIKNKHSVEYAMTQMQISVLEDFRKYWRVLQDYVEGSDEPAIEALKNAQINWGMEKTFSELDWIAKMPTQELKDYLWLAMGRITFGTPLVVSDNVAGRMEVVYKQFIDRADDLKAAGITVRYDKGYERMWLTLDNDPEFIKQKLKFDKDWRRQNYLHPNKRIDPYEKFYVSHNPMLPVENMPPRILAAMESAEETLNTLTHGKVQGTLGDIIYDTIFEEMDAAVPPDIRKGLIPISLFKDNGYFESTLLFNRSNIGLVASRRNFTKKISGIPFKNYMNSAQILVPMLDSRVKAKYLFFDEINNLNGPMYKHLTDSEIFEMLKKEPQLRLAALVKDPKMGARVQEFYVGSVKDITRLRGQLDIAMLPSGTLLQAYKHINYMDISNPVLRFYKKYVVGGLKAGYLSSIGFLMRNIVDSTLKNVLLTEDPSEAPRMLKHMLDTAKLISAYNDIYKEMTQYTDEVILKESQFYSKRVLDRLYEVNPNRKITKEAFQMVHDFMQHGPSAGITNHQININKIKDKKYRKVLGLPANHDIVSKLMWENPWTGFIMDKNGTFEQIVRLAGYTWELNHGATIDEAMEKILKVHFDYSIKSKAMMYLEYVVPFASFFINNTAYWMETLSKFGWVAGLFADITKPIFDLDEYSAEELNQNRSLQYNILAGNVVFDDNLVVKLNPSIMDAINALINPTEELGRTVPWVKLPLEYLYNRIQNEGVSVNGKKLVMTNLPLIGPMIQKVWTAPEDEPWDYGAIQKVYQRTGKRFASYVPSIFGSVQRNYYFTYPGSDMVYMTHGEEKYLEHIKKGALPIAGKIREFAEDYFVRKKKVYKKYTRKYYSKRYYAPKKPRKVWTAGLSAADYYAGARVKATVRGTQLRMPAANSTLRSVKPALMRRLYTGSGRSRFNSRLVPVTPRNLAAKLRSDWRVLS